MLAAVRAVEPVVGSHDRAHAGVLDEIRQALTTRSYYSRYPESPSPRVYGESAAAQGLAAHEAHLDQPYAALLGQPTDGTFVGSEVSPYGPVLGTTTVPIRPDGMVFNTAP